MNYISHFYVSHSYHDQVRLAALFPDIFPKFSFLHNTYFKKFDHSRLSDIELNYWKGIEVHYADDANFHTMDSFNHFNRRIEELLEQSSLKASKRKFLISHILFELILDHWILNQEPTIVSQIYKILEKLPPDSIENFIRKIIQDESQIRPLMDSYQRFVERRFLNFYSEESNLVKALHRVTGKISQWEYNDLTEKSFISIIKQVKSEINYEEIFSYVITNRNPI